MQIIKENNSMQDNFSKGDLVQPALIDFSDQTTGAVELFPAVWSAAEDLISPDINTRLDGLDMLLKLNAPRLSPLVAYLLVSRITDPDITLRTRIVNALGELLMADHEGRITPEPVRRCLMRYLNQMRTRPIFSLLEVVNHFPQEKDNVARIFNTCSNAGRHLADILADRKAPVKIREQAAYYIGLVGYLDAIPALERLSSRLESRLSGQQAMSFAPISATEEVKLLPAIRDTLTLLNAP
jgi:HEAT repeat protein